MGGAPNGARSTHPTRAPQTRQMKKLSCIGALALAIFASPAAVQAPFYQGKQIKIIVGFSPGGGTDLYGRVIADGLSRHAEGRPGAVGQRMPGAGGVIAPITDANKGLPRA